jgi:hypothetical protein
MVKYHDIVSVFDAADEQTPKLKQGLLESRERVLRNAQLMVLRRDAPVTIDITQTVPRPRMGELKTMFETLEFKSMFARAKTVFGDAPSAETKSVHKPVGDSVVESNVESDELYKYTKIDCLDEDKPIHGQKFLCISFISPEGLMNCKTRGFKLRGVYETLDEAKEASKKFQKQDKYFDVYVAEVGKWCPWDPTPQQIKETVYKGKDQNAIMKNIQEKEMQQLNEIVGRQKEKIDDSKTVHKNRVKQSMKENLESYKEEKNKPQTNTENENSQEPTKKRVSHSEKGKELVLERLRKSLAKKNSDAENENQMLKQKLENDSKKIVEQEKTTSTLKKRSEDAEKKIKEMKEKLNKNK